MRAQATGGGILATIPARHPRLKQLAEPICCSRKETPRAAVWRAIVKAIEELQRERGPDEAVN